MLFLVKSTALFRTAVLRFFLTKYVHVNARKEVLYERDIDDSQYDTLGSICDALNF